MKLITSVASTQRMGQANIDIVRCICSLMDEFTSDVGRETRDGKQDTSHQVNGEAREYPLGDISHLTPHISSHPTSNISHPTSHADLISFVTDRPGHDWRYAIDASRMGQELAWKPDETFETGIRKTVEWYLEGEM